MHIQNKHAVHNYAYIHVLVYIHEHILSAHMNAIQLTMSKETSDSAALGGSEFCKGKCHMCLLRA